MVHVICMFGNVQDYEEVWNDLFFFFYDTVNFKREGSGNCQGDCFFVFFLDPPPLNQLSLRETF